MALVQEDEAEDASHEGEKDVEEETSKAVEEPEIEAGAESTKLDKLIAHKKEAFNEAEVEDQAQKLKAESAENGKVNHSPSFERVLTQTYFEIGNDALHASRTTVRRDVRLSNSSIPSYIKLGHLNYASRVFNSIFQPDVVSYSAMIYVAHELLGFCVKSTCFEFVTELLDKMPARDLTSWKNDFSSVVKKSASSVAFEVFYAIFVAIREGSRVDYFPLSSFVIARARSSSTMYGRNLGVTNALIPSCAKCGGVEDVEPLFSIISVSNDFSWNAMVNAYMGFGLVSAALDLLRKIPEKNSVAYNSLLSGFCNNGDGSKALRVFCRMVEVGVQFTDFTLTGVPHACALSKNSKFSTQLYAFVPKIGCGSNDDYARTALLDMCTRCSRMDDAEKIFHPLPLERRSIMLTTMRCGYSKLLELRKTISLISYCHTEDRVAIDVVSLASILGVCGDMEFQTLGEQFEPKAYVWKSLLGSYRLHAHSIVRRRAAKEILSLETQESSTYALKLNLYSASRRWRCCCCAMLSITHLSRGSIWQHMVAQRFPP